MAVFWVTNQDPGLSFGKNIVDPLDRKAYAREPSRGGAF
jgi:hypothetical protein